MATRTMLPVAVAPSQSVMANMGEQQKAMLQNLATVTGFPTRDPNVLSYDVESLCGMIAHLREARAELRLEVEVLAPRARKSANDLDDARYENALLKLKLGEYSNVNLVLEQNVRMQNGNLERTQRECVHAQAQLKSVNSELTGCVRSYKLFAPEKQHRRRVHHPLLPTRRARVEKEHDRTRRTTRQEVTSAGGRTRKKVQSLGPRRTSIARMTSYLRVWAVMTGKLSSDVE